VGESEYAVNKNNPVLNNDPDGDCPWCVGAAAGAALDAGIQLLEIAIDEKKSLKDFSFKSVVVSAVTGAAGVSIATKITKLSTVAKVAVEVATDAASSVIEQKIKDGEVDATKVGISVIFGQTVGKRVGNVVQKYVEKGKYVKNLQDLREQVLSSRGKLPKQIRREKVREINKEIETYKETRSGAASYVASGITSYIIEKYADKKTDKKNESTNSNTSSNTIEIKSVTTYQKN
jgi:Tfp pilus assembly major pilin PilA